MASARHIMEEFDYGVDEAELAQLSAQWARQHAGELVTGLTETSRNGLRELIGTAQEQGWSMGQVRDALTNVYGPVRAEMIAITETTRANIEGEAAIMQMLTDAGLRVQAIWRTAGDEAVCPICAPLDGLVQGEDWIDPPPAHPRCRCELEYEVRA
jgi:hypothetical protein